MPLSQQQIDEVRKLAEALGVAPDELLKMAEQEQQAELEKGQGNAPDGQQSAEPPKLFQYHLPFVRVREVRRIWLGLDEPFEGDEEVAAAWAAKFGTPASPAKTDE